MDVKFGLAADTLESLILDGEAGRYKDPLNHANLLSCLLVYNNG